MNMREWTNKSQTNIENDTKMKNECGPNNKDLKIEG